MFVEHKEQGEVTEAPAKLDEASRMLLRTAALIEERGLAKFMRCDPEGRLCFYGALTLACAGNPNGDHWSSPSGLEAARRVERAVGEPDASNWNNADERTQSEVVSKLRAVALGL